MEDLKRFYRQAVAERARTLEDALETLPAAPAEAAPTIRRVAHSLRGSGGTYGFPEVSAAAGAVEEAAETDLAVETGRLVALLRRIATDPGTLSPAGDASRTTSATRVLVIDDDPEIRLLLRYTLAAPDRELSFAVDAAEARSRLDAERFDLILLDLVLPDADGRSLLQRIRALVPPPPVLVLTGRDREDVRAECLAGGAAECFAKPFDPERIAAAVTAQLRAREGSPG